MTLEKLSQQISQSGGKQTKLPPVELWDPPYCGEIDLVIKANGDWFYNGSIFKRLSLVKLFASVLKKEGDDYFLVTPVEKVKITVEDCPFVLTQWQWHEDKRVMQVSTNLGDEFLLDGEHQSEVTTDGTIEVIVRRNLRAKVHRNVYYQWIELAEEIQHQGKAVMAFQSGDLWVVLGEMDEQ